MRLSGATCLALLLSLDMGDGAAAAAQACRAVRHPQLEALLPVLPGFVRQRPVGETDDDEHVARVTVDYEAGAARISIELMDTCRNVDMLSQLREFLNGGAPVTAGTVIRRTQIKGFPAHEEWTAESQHTEIHILVADRFTAAVTGELVNRPVVQTAAETIDLQRLAALK